jgi:hypothetical protein
MHDLATQAQHLATLRARILLDDHALDQARRSEGIAAAEAFAERLRIGVMRRDDIQLTAALRRDTCGANAIRGRRFDLLMQLVDEVATLEFEAATGGDQLMRRSMMHQAAGEMRAAAQALEAAVPAPGGPPPLHVVA